ncbi:MAG: cation transporter, partial [Myxococcota bacterium]
MIANRQAKQQTSVGLIQEHDERTPQVRQVLWKVLVVNLMVALLKGVAGAVSGSAALLADAIHSSFDAANNILGLMAMGI